MIFEHKNYLTKIECDYIISLHNKANHSNQKHHRTIKFYSTVLTDIDLGTDKFDNFDFDRLRVQYVDETIDQVPTFHIHQNNWNFVLFLNSNFKGGELEFHDKVFKPETGTMVYFTGNEFHKLNNCVGERYSLVGFLNNNPIDNNIVKSLL